MNPIQKAAWQLDLGLLRSWKLSKENGDGALLCACSAHNPDPKSQEKVISFLLKLGSDVNETDKNGVSPLHRAVTNTGAPGTSGKDKEIEELIRILIAAGADAHIRNKMGKRPIDYVKDERIRKLVLGK